MTALELADTLLSKETRLTNDHLCEAVSTLRRQHEAIKQLREACQKVVVAFDALPRDNEARYSDLQINAARIALKDTEELV